MMPACGRSAIDLSRAVRREQRAARRARANRVCRGLGQAPDTRGTQQYAWQTHCFIPVPMAAVHDTSHRQLLPKLTGPATQRHDTEADDAMAWSPRSTTRSESASRKGRHERAMLLPALSRLERRRALWAASDPVHSVLHQTMYVPPAGLPGSMLPPLEDRAGEDERSEMARTRVDVVASCGNDLTRTCTNIGSAARTQRLDVQKLAGGCMPWTVKTDIEPVRIK